MTWLTRNNKPWNELKGMLLITLLSCINATSNSQDIGHFKDDESANFQIWTDYNPSWSINQRLTLRSAFSARTIFPSVWYRFFARPSVSYQKLTFNKKTEMYRAWEFHRGIGMFYTANLEKADNIEIRPYQGFRVRFPNLQKFHLSHFIRLEERIEIGAGSSFNNFSMRFRYRIGTDLYLPGEFFLKGFYIPLSAEFFVNLARGSQFNDLMRITPGFGYTPNENRIFQRFYKLS